MATWRIICGDVLNWQPDDGWLAHACFCDAPYGLGKTPDMVELLTAWLNGQHYDTGPGFMGKSFDVVPSPAMWRNIFSWLHTGAVLATFAGTRTADLMGVAIRLAGFEKFDEIEMMGANPDRLYVYGAGFPKSARLSKAIDHDAGAEREIICESPYKASDEAEQRTRGKCQSGATYMLPSPHPPRLSQKHLMELERH